jgi:hypothetical protein
MNIKLSNLSEGCGCDQQDKTNKLKEKLKAKYLGNTTPQGKPDLYITEHVNSISDLNLNKLIGKKALLESDEGTFFGTFGQFKGNCALYEGEFLKKVVYSQNIVKIICENVKIIIDKPEKKRKHAHTITDNSDGELIQEEIHKRGEKYVVTTEGGGRVLGTHPTKEKALKQLAAVEISKRSVNEDISMLLCDRLKTRFFGSITEEIVNKDNEFSMSPAEIRDRDRRADAMLRSKSFNPQLKNGDTKEEAAHRIATAQVIDARSGNGYKGADLFSSVEGLTRKQRKGAKRQLQGGKEFEKREKAITKKSRTGGNRKTPARNPEEADEQTRRKQRVTNRRTVANIRGTQGATFKQGKAARERGDSRTAYAATNPGLFQ